MKAKEYRRIHSLLATILCLFFTVIVRVLVDY
jgi:hypothetical protein